MQKNCCLITEQRQNQRKENSKTITRKRKNTMLIIELQQGKNRAQKKQKHYKKGVKIFNESDYEIDMEGLIFQVNKKIP